MKKFEFEVQNLQTCIVYAESAEDARMKLVENTEEYVDMFSDCGISDGREVE